MSQKELEILDTQLAMLAASDAHQPMPLKQWLKAAWTIQAGKVDPLFWPGGIYSLAPRSWWREKHRAGVSPLQAVQAAERYDRLRRDREANAPTLAAIEARLGLPCSNQSKEAHSA